MTILNNSTECTIDTITPVLQLGQIQISADRRTSTANPIPEDQRIRRVVLPANYWGTLQATQNGNTSQSLTDILTNGLRTLANARLKDALQENPLARTILLADYSVSSLLAWSADTASSRGALTFDRDAVSAWFPTSKLFTVMATKGAGWTDFMAQRLGCLAAKNHGLKKPEDASKLIVLLADDAGLALDNLANDLIQRLTHIEKSLTARTATVAISMDDL